MFALCKQHPMSALPSSTRGGPGRSHWPGLADRLVLSSAAENVAEPNDSYTVWIWVPYL